MITATLPSAPTEFTPAQKEVFGELVALHVADGAKAVMAAALAAREALQLGPFAPDGVQVVRADGVAVQRVEWLWNGYLPRGKLSLIAGPAGTSKTTLALAL